VKINNYSRKKIELSISLKKAAGLGFVVLETTKK
jgi:hypothetical protein